MEHKLHKNPPGFKNWIMSLILLGSYTLTMAQEGSQGNTTVFNGAQATFFGTHTFVAGGEGTQPGIIKTMRTAPIGIVNYATSADHTGATDANHIDGYVGKYGTAAFTFPIGDGTKLRPASISAPTSGDFKAAYWFSNPDVATLPSGAPFSVANLGAGVVAVSNVEYWDVDGSSAINLTLSWDAASALGTLTTDNIANLIVVGYNPTTSKWENLGNAGGTTGALATTGTVTAQGVTPDTYSAFTFGAAVPIVPDLTPAQFFSDPQLSVGEETDYVAAISNVGVSPTTTSFEFLVTNFGSATGLTITLNPAASVEIDGDVFNLNNSDFNVVTTSTRFTFTSKPGVVIPVNGAKYIGFKVTRNGGSNGANNNTVTITNGTGGDEAPFDNNSISNLVNKN